MRRRSIWLPVYAAGYFTTLVYLMFFAGYRYNAWNWLVAIPANMFLSTIWPLYWGLLRWIF